MQRKHIQGLSTICAIALLFFGIWSYFTYDILRNERSTVGVSNTPSDEQLIIELQDQVQFEEYNTLHNALTPPVTDAIEPPAMEERLPGSTLSKKALADMEIEGPIEQEQIFYAMLTPDDTIYPQWYTTVIDAPTAWDRSTGNPSTIVAVIDTGFALDHEDLSTAWFVNAGEQGTTQIGDTCWTGVSLDKQTNNCDDDENGFVDDWRGWDFANADNNPQAGDNDPNGANHGTKSAGLVGARGNNTTGVAAVNWQTQLLPLQGLTDAGYGFSTDIASAIYYAVEMGADVINMSLGGPYPDTYTRAAVRYAQNNNVIVVAASGNCGENQTDSQCIGFASPGGMGYPALYPESIAVGATTSTDTRATFSSYGPELDIVAPGSGSIRTPTWATTNETSLYASTSYGTSFSAPIVSSAVALIRGEYPEITADEIIAILANSADKPTGMGSSFRTDEYGFGRLNVAALQTQLDTYQLQLTKGSGPIQPISSNQLPQIASSTGHTVGSKITPSDTVYTYCVSEPRVLCSLVLENAASSATTTIATLRTNNQGIARFEWTSNSVPDSGIWNGLTKVGTRESLPEKLFIQ